MCNADAFQMFEVALKVPLHPSPQLFLFQAKLASLSCLPHLMQLLAPSPFWSPPHPTPGGSLKLERSV